MAPAKKSRRSVKKAKQPRKLSVAELIEAAEQALTLSDDPRHAVTLYTVALTKAEADAAPPIPMLQQVELLEKRAEVHVSLQNQSEALRDYQAALARLEQHAKKECIITSSITEDTTCTGGSSRTPSGFAHVHWSAIDCDRGSDVLSKGN